MLHLVQSNKMEMLAQQLVVQLKKQSGSETSTDFQDPFDALKRAFHAQTILVQSPGMAQGLKLHIADALGICSNYQFPLPSSFIWGLYKQFIDQLPEESAFTKPNMTWKLLEILPGKLDEPAYAILAQYLKGIPCEYASRKLFQLCGKIADVFDQYLMYRPDWILDWEQGKDSFEQRDIVEQRWQSDLWRTLVSYTGTLGESQYHRVNQHHLLLEKLQKTPTEHTPLYVFGISAIPESQLQVLEALSLHREVHVYWLNPSAHFWADVVDGKQLLKTQLSLFEQNSVEDDFSEVGNPLLAKWGKVGRDFQTQVLNRDVQQYDHFVEPGNANLLCAIQQDIHELEFRGARVPLSSDDYLRNDGEHPKKCIQDNDKSIEIARCHSMQRELEVLYDKVLSWFSEGIIASPDDVIVMMPDVGKYASLIETVFSNKQPISDEDADAIAIPVAISDRGRQEEEPLLEAFLTIQNLFQSRFSLSQVFSLFELPEVFNSYEVAPEDIPKIRSWCESANIRWGKDAQHKMFFDVPTLHQNTWRHGLDRMLSGYAMMGEQAMNIPDMDEAVLPLAEIEGQALESLGKFILFVDDLFTSADSLSNAASLQQKIQQSLSISRQFFSSALEHSSVLVIHEVLNELHKHQHQFSGAISQDVFVSVLKQSFSEKGVGQRFLAGRLNFCTLMPMRSIPFKVVCLLGMDDISYPRTVPKISFDQVNHLPARLGDRSRRMDDRYLFLEALLSAREKFYLSYVGFSTLDNSALPGSILVNELIDYCGLGYCLTKDLTQDPLLAEQNLKKHLIFDYPLQPFSPNNFSSVGSYLTTWFPVAESLNSSCETASSELPFIDNLDGLDIGKFGSKSNGALLKTELDIDELSVDIGELCVFIRNPVKFYFKHKWQTQFSELQVSSDDDEPLTINALERYWLLQELVVSEESVLDAFSERGQLPAGNMKSLETSKLIAAKDELFTRFSLATGEVFEPEKLHQVRFNLSQDSGLSYDLEAHLPLYSTSRGNIILLWRPGKLRAIDRLHLAIQYCAAVLHSANRVDVQTGYFIAKDKTYRMHGISRDDAQDFINLIVSLYCWAKHYALPFFPETSRVWALTQDEVKSQAQYVGSAFQAGEGQELHVNRVFPSLPIEQSAFKQLAHDIYSPLESFGSEL
ncbi:MAG: exodeoxyribonuclease V subunit gamma [Alteromonadaceae bacterium]|nr:exodeoxyribonuclease V subunit gamma [Alteromonadaceae bacterium]